MKSTKSCVAILALAASAFAADQVKTAQGTVEGIASEKPGVRMFRGIPFAQPPVGDLRWKAPQPPKNWTGVRQAKEFGPRCMQRAVFGDMQFRGGLGEDCLYLNVWTPAKSGSEKLPVLVYFYGGGLMAGDGSEPRYDGESMARRGIVAVTVNYRLAVFGFMAHPELSKEAPYHASGNYGFLDQTAALKWVQQNIAAFGGDPKRVTIAGESAGSISVSAQMASPLAKGMMAGGIMESGSIIGALSAVPLAEGEQAGVKFAGALGAKSLAELRAMPAEKILEATANPAAGRFSPVLDGYLFPKPIADIVDAGEQAHIPLLGGSNSEEQGARGVLGRNPATPEGYRKAIEGLYGDKAAEVLKLYPGKTEEEILDSAAALASDRFIAFSTWRFMEGCRKTGGKPVYRYYYAHPRPKFVGGSNLTPGLAGGVVATKGNTPPPPPARGAVHSAEIEYAMGNLSTNKNFAWGPDDYKVSEQLETYFANFIKTGNPNGAGVPNWPAYSDKDGFQILRIDVTSRAVPEKAPRERYQFLDPFYVKH